MAIDDDAAEAQARGWRRLAALQARIENRIGAALEADHDLSVSEFTVLDVLGRQDDWHMRMQQLANAVVLSQSSIFLRGSREPAMVSVGAPTTTPRAYPEIR